jgi:hypothetical protein
MGDERRNYWCCQYCRNPPAVAAPLSVSAGRPCHRHARRRSWRRYQELDAERGAVRILSGKSGHAGCTGSRRHSADGLRSGTAANGADRAATQHVFDDNAKFRKPVGPGDTLEYHIDKLAKCCNIWWYRGEAKVGSVLVAEVELGACLAEN